MPNSTIGETFGRRVGRRTLTGHPLVVGTHQVGIEVELEGMHNARFNSEYWEVKHDGSLRNGGQEFVFRGPTGGVDLYNAVVELDSYLFDKNPDASWRCSTHVHLDVRDLTGEQLKNLILIYVVYEKFLFRLSGMHRYSNNFCAAIGFAQQQLGVLSRFWNNRGTSAFCHNVVGMWDKYSALNLLPMTNFGSVEFRLSEALWRKGKLLLLCNRYLAMKEFAKSWQGTHQELVEFLINVDPRQVLDRGCPRDLPPETNDDLQTGYKLAYDLITFSTDKAKVVFPQPWGINEVMIAHASGTAPRPRIDVGMFMDGSPGIRLSDNVGRWVRDNMARHANTTVPRMLCNLFTYSALEHVSEITGMGISNLLHGPEWENYSEWVDAGKPLQEVNLEAGVPPVAPRPFEGGNIRWEVPQPVRAEDLIIGVEDDDDDVWEDDEEAF